MAKVAIVHAQADSSIAERLSSALRGAGHDARLMAPDERGDQGRIGFMIWLVSPASLEARHVHSQIFMVMDTDRLDIAPRKLLPVFVDAEARTRALAQIGDLAMWPLFDLDDLDVLLGYLESHDDRGAMADLAFDDEADEVGDDATFAGEWSLDDDASVNENLAEKTAPPPARGTSAAMPARSTLEVLEGRLVHRIPNAMRIGLATQVEVRVGEAGTVGLTHGLAGGGALVQEDLAMVETMTVELVAPGGAFTIEAQTPVTQLVAGDVLSATTLAQARYGRWLWLVTPKTPGKQDLVVRVAAVIADSRNIPTSVLLPERNFTVRVRVSYSAMGWSLARWAVTGLAGMVAAGFIGAATTDWWWPAVKAWLEGF